MSARRSKLELAPGAQRDLRSIRAYSVKQWGVRQANAYRAALRRGLDTLRDHPRIGRTRDDLSPPGLWSLQIEHHVVYYRIGDDAIEVARILHEKQDAASVFVDDLRE
jgi:toxin ParE1/3/4